MPTGLNRVVTETVELFGRALIERNIHAHLQLDPDLPPVIANLVMNAMDAMPGGGTVTISTSREDLTHDTRPLYPLLPPGIYAVLSVQDTGTGIPREIVDRIFEPFFTTKPAGKGTGLGLAMVYGIVKSHKGEVRVSSQEGKGTTFAIHLPVSEQQVPASLEEAAAVRVPPAAHGERIFVVDDEQDVLSSIRDNLELQGYKVFTADSPEQALELFERISGEVDVVISDIVMPVMNGAELTRRLKKIKPKVKVIGMSSFDGGNLVSEAGHIDCFLKKPFDGGSLLTCVHRALNVR